MKHDFFSGLFGAALLSVPFGLIWNKLAPLYAGGLPPAYLHLPFWHCMGLFVMAAILRSVFFGSRTFNSWKFRTRGWRPGC